MKKIGGIILKVLAGIIGTVALLLLLVVLLIRLPAIQQIISSKVISYVSSRTHTKIELGKILIAFPKAVVIEKLYAEDESRDTLLYLEKLKVDINMMALLKKKIVLNNVSLEGVNAHIYRHAGDSTFNYDFLVRAFSPADSNEKTQKDTSGKSWEFKIQELELSNISASYVDALTGTDIHGQIGSLNLDMNEIDIGALNFDAKHLKIENTHIAMAVNETTVEKAVDTVVGRLPSIALDKAELQNVSFAITNDSGSQSYKFYAGHLEVVPEKIALNKRLVQIHSLELDSGLAAIAIAQNESAKSRTDTGNSVQPGWRFSASDIRIKRSGFKYDVPNASPVPQGVDYNHLDVQHLALEIRNASYSAEQIVATIKNGSFREKSGFELRHLATRASYNNQSAELLDLSLSTPHTHISKHIAVRYPSIQNLGKNSNELSVSVDLQDTRIGVKDILLFAPSLKSQPVFNDVDGVILLSGDVKGSLNDLMFRDIRVKTADATELIATGRIRGLPQALHAHYDIRVQKFLTTQKDVRSLFGNKIPDVVNVPVQLSLSGEMQGSITDMNAKLALRTTSGDADIEARLHQFQGDTQYNVNLSTRNLDIGFFIKSKAIGPVTGQVTVEGKNFSPNRIVADARVHLKELTLNGYPYNNIDLTALDSNGYYNASLTVQDENLAMKMDAYAALGKAQESIVMNVDVSGANLQKMNLLKSDIRVAGKMYSLLQGERDDMKGRVAIGNVTVIKNEDIYRLASLLDISVNDPKNVATDTKNGVVNIDYQGTTNVQNFGEALTAYINRYFKLETDSTVISDTTLQDFTLNVVILPHPVVSGVLLEDLDKFNGVELKAQFNGKKQKMDIVANVDAISYKSTSLNHLIAELHSDNKHLEYRASINELRSGDYHLEETVLDGTVQSNSIGFHLKISNDSVTKLIAGGALTQNEPGSYTLRLDDDKLVFGNKKYSIPKDNYLRFYDGGIEARNMELRFGDELLALNSATADATAPLELKFNHFHLSTLSQILEKDTALIRGIIDGEVVLKTWRPSLVFVSDLEIDSVSFRQNPLGKITLKADNLTENQYSAALNITGAGNDVKISGHYMPSGETNELNFQVDIDKLQVKSIEGFTGGQIRNSSGYLTGEMSLTGRTKQPVMKGAIRFKDVDVHLAYLNNTFAIKDDQVRIDEKGVYFNSFKIRDANGQNAVVNGSVLTTDFRKMKFDMQLTTDKFTAMNTGIQDNSLFFGKVIISSRLTIQGNESLPVVRADAKILNGSEFTFVVPASRISADRGEGVVLLRDTANQNAIMRVEDTVTLTTFKGIDLSANLEINKGSTLKVIVDKRSGDSLVVRGDGILSFSIDESGEPSLVGSYVLSSGGYKASFQNIIKKEFSILDGSTITWAGNPLGASVDITALYRTRAPAADLLAAELSGSSASDRSLYRKPLRFIVLMNMKGTLLRPDIHFQLDMDDRDKEAFGGTVYSKINSLNNDRNELNKQVFSLLVLGTFVPTGSGNGSDPVGTMARNSVNQILTDQLNRLSARYIKGVDLNFGIQSNDEFTTEGVNKRTEVSVGLRKEFFKNRLSVEVGTSMNVEDNTGTITQNNAGTITGDFLVEYKLTEDGRIRLKAFRQNQYESVIDGLLYKTGVGILFKRDYDKLSQIFKRPEKVKPDSSQ